MKPNSEVRKLASDVAALAVQLQRPICSRDLAAYYATGNDQPLLLQCLCQILVKAAREYRRTKAQIRKVGMHEGRAYYAVGDDPCWTERFERFCLVTDLRAQVRLDLPVRSRVLVGTEFEAVMRNALAGFLVEWRPRIVRYGEINDCQAPEFEKLLEDASRLAAPKFVLKHPRSLVDRSHAAKILREEYGRRMIDVDASSMNVKRHLAVLRWPQSTLFRPFEQKFWSLQVHLHCSAKWSMNNREDTYAAIIRDLLRYGSGDHEIHRL